MGWLYPNEKKMPLSSCADDLALIGEVHERAFRKCIPLSVSIETTLRCNIRCLHCYNFDRNQRRLRPDAPDLTPSEILNLMTELRREGCLFLALTGGEVLSHPHLFDFLDHALSLHFSVRLLTNGTLLEGELVRQLAYYQNLAALDLSLYGASAEVHDAITQTPGSFARTWAGAVLLRDSGVTVHLKFILMRQNAHEAAAMIESAESSGFSYAIDFTITGRYDGTNGSLDARIREEDIEPLLRGPLRDRVTTRGPEVTSESFACNCARANCAVSAQGDVYPCIAVPWKAGNIRQQPFAEIWRHSPVFEEIRNLRLQDYLHCSPCPHKAWCPRARGATYLVSGKYTGIDPFVCRTAEVIHRIAIESSL